MADWSKPLNVSGHTLESCFDALVSRLRSRAGSGRKLQILPYLAYGTDTLLTVKGRVLLERAHRVTTDHDLWENIIATYRRLNTTEVPNARIRVTSGQNVSEAIANDEGFFECQISGTGSTEERWRAAQFELLEPVSGSPVAAQGRVLVPPRTAKFGIISDIDDTIILSHATNLAQLARTVFLQNARQRVAFPGVAPFYRALAGADGANPLFYVSSGPWNLYDLILELLELNAIPLGPILLQDYGFDNSKFLCSSHSAHKGDQISRILNTYPDLPFILIGDSGQKDPEIYRKILEDFPHRIRAIYIRDVTKDARDAEVRKLAEQSAIAGGDLVLVRDSLEAATHAASLGLISQSNVDEVISEVSTAQSSSQRDESH